MLKKKVDGLMSFLETCVGLVVFTIKMIVVGLLLLIMISLFKIGYGLFYRPVKIQQAHQGGAHLSIQVVTDDNFHYNKDIFSRFTEWRTGKKIRSRIDGNAIIIDGSIEKEEKIQIVREQVCILLDKKEILLYEALCPSSLSY